MNYPKISKIIDVKKENKDVKTFLFKNSEITNPGQFYMIWIPGVDEIPMSVSHIKKNIKGITFKRVGEATNALYNLKKNERIGIRGPYGNGFKLRGKNFLFIAGGTGIAMIAPAVEIAQRKKIKSTVIIGVKNKNDLFFEKRILKTNAKLYITTDDGSKGYKGFASDLAKELLKNEKFDKIYTCGPEKMMKKIFEISKDVPVQVSLERYMKCGIGICGQCCVGKGLRVCKDGPIFNKDELNKMKDFGLYKRDSSGTKVKI